MNHREKVIMGLMHCLPLDGCDNCPYQDEYRCDQKLLVDTLPLLRNASGYLHIILRRDVMDGWGHGWLEEWLEDDEGISHSIMECVWFYGQIMVKEDRGSFDVIDREEVELGYNRKPGMRIWNTLPTAEETEAEKWQ